GSRVAFSADGSLFAAFEYKMNAPITVRESGSTRVISKLQQEYPSDALAFSPNGRVLAAADNQAPATIRLWDVSDGREAKTFGQASYVSCIAFNPTGSMIGAIGNEGTIRAWEVESGREIPSSIKSQEILGKMRNMSWSRDGRLIAA